MFRKVLNKWGTKATFCNFNKDLVYKYWQKTNSARYISRQSLYSESKDIMKPPLMKANSKSHERINRNLPTYPSTRKINTASSKSNLKEREGRKTFGVKQMVTTKRQNQFSPSQSKEKGQSYTPFS